MKNLRIAHISPDIFEKSSSFIQANILGLDGTVVPFYGGYFPTNLGNNVPLELSIWEKGLFKFKNQIGGLNRAEYAFYKALKRERIDLIFTEYGPTACAIMRTIEKYKAPLLVHFHGYDVYHLPTIRKHKANYDKLISLQANAIAVSKEMKQELISWGFPSERVIYSPCGCHSRFIELQVPKERAGFIAVGRMVEKKGPLYTIKAFELALKNGLKDNLTFIGDGPLMDTCKHYVAENKLEDYIHFLGHQSHDFVLERMLNAKVFLQHSVTSSEGDKEGTPVSVVEAMAVCMPVISTYHAGIQDVVAHGENGYLVHEKDIVEMSRYILALSEDEEKCREMGNRGRMAVQKNFTDKSHLEAINDFIEKIMS